MKSSKVVRLVYLIFAVAFCLPLVLWGFLLKNYFFNKQLVESGTKVTAIVRSYEVSSPTDDNPQYKLIYEYLDTNGQIHYGETDYSYSFYEAVNTKFVDIVYDENFNSINKNSVEGLHIELFVLPIFGVVGVAFWVVFIKSIVSIGAEKKIKNLGKEQTANFVTSGSGLTINGCPYYYLKYNFVQNDGTIKEVKTASKYSFEEVEFFRLIQQFKIKVLKGKSSIIEKIDISKLYTNSTNKQSIAQMPKFKQCVYCGSVVSETDKKCPNCGSVEFKTNKEKEM